MFITKKRIASLFLLLILGILQINTLAIATPAKAADLLSGQPLLQEVGSRTYGAGQKDVKVIALDLLTTALGFLALIFLALFVFAGFKWMTSQGNDSKIKEATGQMTAAAVGLLIVLASWGISRYVLKVIICNTTVTNGNCYSIW
jgi:hypothetical protein